MIYQTDYPNKKLIDTLKYDELLLDVIFQACGIEDNKIDNQCLSAYEEACDYLASKGLITTDNGRIYKIRKEKQNEINKNNN